MAGLPCEECQEGMFVIPCGTVMSDASGRTVYRRYRVCITPSCSLYLIRRETFEVAAPLRPDAKLLPADKHQLARLGLPERTSPLPELLCTPERQVP